MLQTRGIFDVMSTGTIWQHLNATLTEMGAEIEGVDLSQPIGPDTQMFPAYPAPTFTQWTTREMRRTVTPSR